METNRNELRSPASRNCSGRWSKVCHRRYSASPPSGCRDVMDTKIVVISERPVAKMLGASSDGVPTSSGMARIFAHPEMLHQDGSARSARRWQRPSPTSRVSASRRRPRPAACASFQLEAGRAERSVWCETNAGSSW